MKSTTYNQLMKLNIQELEEKEEFYWSRYKDIKAIRTIKERLENE